MKIEIRYDNEVQVVNVDTEEVSCWLNLKIEEEESEEEYEERVQDEFNEMFNKPEYNNWHKHNRHIGTVQYSNFEDGLEINSDEALLHYASDNRKFSRSIECVEEKMEYEEVYKKLNKILNDKAAQMVMAIAVDKVGVNEYAALIGDTPNNVSHRYRRALEKLKKYFSKTSFMGASKG